MTTHSWEGSGLHFWGIEHGKGWWGQVRRISAFNAAESDLTGLLLDPYPLNAHLTSHYHFAHAGRSSLPSMYLAAAKEL